ncbi:MAG: RNA polymerase sigma factor [Bacillota bacterium]
MEYLKYLSKIDDPDAVLIDMMHAYGNDVWNYAYLLTRRRDAADDISQDVFLKVYRNLFGFRGEASIKTWLLGITRNTAFNYRRSAFFRKVLLMDRIVARGQHRSAENEAIDLMATKQLWSIVLQLPAIYREVLMHEAHYQLTYREIAHLLGISEGTVKSRLHRARAKVEMTLKEEEGK